jgi:hypothetical protein
MKLPVFVLLMLAALSNGQFRAQEVSGNTQGASCVAYGLRLILKIDRSGTSVCNTAFNKCDRRPNGIPAQFCFLQNSVHCVSFDYLRLQIIEWSGSGHTLVLLEIGGRRYA